jgi:hypothetical protein
MRKVLGPTLTGLGGFLLVMGILLWTVVPGAVKKTPLDIDSVTKLTGNASVLPSGPGSAVKALSHTVANGEASDSDVVVFDTFTCMVKSSFKGDCTKDTSATSPLITAGTETFATDRRTAEAVTDEKYVEAGDPHAGLINKFPFDVEQRTYAMYDGMLRKTVDAKFEGSEDLNGLTVYRFAMNTKNAAAEISKGIKGTYSSDKTLWIDPTTGSIINQEEHQVRKLPDGKTVLDLKLAFTDETVANNVEAAQANASKIGLLGTLAPIFLVLGLLSALGGFLLSRRAAAGRDVEYVDHGRSANDQTLLNDLGDEDTTRRRDIHN